MIGGETGVTNGQASAEQSLVDSTGSAGIQGSSDGRREPKSSRKKGSDGMDVRKNSERGSGSLGASSVMAGSGASATGGSSAAAVVVDERRNKKNSSSFRKVWGALDVCSPNWYLFVRSYLYVTGSDTSTMPLAPRALALEITTVQWYNRSTLYVLGVRHRSVGTCLEP